MKILVLTLAMAFVACADDGESDGITVDVAVASQTLPQSVATRGGGSATLDRSFVTVVGFELEPCTSIARTLWRAVNPLPSAFAHGESSPTTLAVPTVIAIAGQRAAIAAGTIEPPPERYCGMTLAVGVADDDAVALPDDDMVGKSLRVTGAAQGSPFSVTSAASDQVHLTFAAPLELSASNTHAVVTLSLETTDTFAAVDFAQVSAGTDILTGLRSGFRVSVQ